MMKSLIWTTDNDYWGESEKEKNTRQTEREKIYLNQMKRNRDPWMR